MPDARCTRGLIRKWRRGAHEHTGSAEAPGIPCAAALRLMPCSPRRRIRLVTVVGGFGDTFNPVGSNLSPPTWHQQRVSGPHGFAVRSKRRSSCAPCHRSRGSTRPATAFARRRSRVHHIPSRVRDDRDTPPCRNGTNDLKPLIWGRCEAQSCPSCHCAAALSFVVIPGRARARTRNHDRLNSGFDALHRPGMTALLHSHRHCERSEAIHGAASGGMDCFVAEFIIGPAEGGTRWLLAMTAEGVR